MTNQFNPMPSHNPNHPRRLKFFATVNTAEEKATVQLPAVNGNGVHRPPASARPLRRSGPLRHTEVRPLVETGGREGGPSAAVAGRGTSGLLGEQQRWVPGTFGFDSAGDVPQSLPTDTLPMMVLRGISNQQGQAAPVMQSEISGAAVGAAVVGIGNFTGNILKFACNFLIQRGFGPATYGLYIISSDLVTLVASNFNLGLDNAMIRYTSIYRGKQQSSSLRGLTIFCTVLAGVFGLLGAFLVLFFAPALAAFRHEPKTAFLLRLMAPLVPLFTMQIVWFGGLQGFKAFKFRVLSERIVPPILLFVFLGVVLVFYRKVGGIALAAVCSTMVGTVMSLYFLFRNVSRVSGPEPVKYEMREWLSFATPNLLTSTSDFLLQSTATILLVFFSISDISIGQYGAANKFSIFVAMPLVSLNSMFTPTIAELYSKGEVQKLAAMFKIVTKWTITLSLPIFLVVAVFSRSLLGLSGPIFAAAWPLLVVLAIGNMFNAGTGCIGYMLMMTGHQKLSFLNSLSAVVISVLVGALLTPRFGAMGTAISTGLSVIVVNLLRMLQVALLLKMHPYRWDTLKPIGAGLVSMALTGVLLLGANYIHINLLLQLCLVPVFVLCYIGCLLLFKIGPEDQIVVSTLSKKLLRGRKK